MAVYAAQVWADDHFAHPASTAAKMKLVDSAVVDHDTRVAAVETRRTAPTGTAPGVAAGANNGTTPPAPTDVGANDSRGVVLFGSGATPAAGAQVVVSFAVAYAAAPVVVLTAGNAATQALGLFVSSVGTGGFTVSTVSAPTASQAATVYSVAFQAIG